MSLLGNFAHLLPGSSRTAKSNAPRSRAEDPTEDPAEDEDQDELEDEEEQDAAAEDEEEAEDSTEEEEAEDEEETPKASSPSGRQRSTGDRKAVREGRRAERARWSGVLANKAAGHGRLGTALALLSTTQMSETQIVAALKSMPKQAGGSRLDAAMSGIRPAEVGASGGERPANVARSALSASVKAQVDRMTGQKGK